MAAAKGNDYTLKRKVRPQYTKKQIEDIAASLLDYAENSKSIHLAPWCRKQEKSTCWLNELASRHPEIKEAHKQAKVLLGAKVLNSSFYGEGNASVGMAYLPVYDKEFKDLLEWKARLNQQTSESIKTTFTEMKNAVSDGSLLEMLKQQEETKK
jgi:hypothetical protein